MSFELHCSRCRRTFRVPAGSQAAATLAQVAEQGPWCALGDGETFDDAVSSALGNQERAGCPECGGQVSASEDSLSQFAQELLGQW